MNTVKIMNMGKQKRYTTCTKRKLQKKVKSKSLVVLILKAKLPIEVQVKRHLTKNLTRAEYIRIYFSIPILQYHRTKQ